MKNFVKSRILMLLPLAAMLVACEQKIDLQLNDADPKIVIEGWITDQPGPYDFKVSRSSPYLGDGAESHVTGAQLILRDDLGNVDTLVETGPGWYQTTDFQGQREHNYFLDVTVEGQKYSATNYLPRINPLLGTGYEYNDTMVFGAGYYVGLLAQEPAGRGDFYQFRFTRNDTVFNSIADLLVSDDAFVDGQLSPFLFPYPNRLGDSIVVEVRAVSAKTYDFFVTLFQQGTGSGGPFASVPDNLATNFDNGAVGWFGAAAVVNDSLVIQ
ncbi:MAG: DUF4249 domain-containing protein [Bacteroidetes bacterium]|nr:DUF4249 domain-containing protein [Bacteroidota bacterium]MBP6722823.1 DUF4249 domain-containing protein [Bacteroidia bacterium]